MLEHTNTKDSCSVLLIDAAEAEVTQLRKNMPNWLWIEAPEGWPFEKETKPIDRSFQAIIVFAGQDSEEHTLAICKHIYEKQLLSELPLLVAGSRYQMALVHAIKRLSRGKFIFTPIKEESLLNEIEQSRVKQS